MFVLYFIFLYLSDDIGILQEAKVNLMSRSLCNKPEYWNYTVPADMLCVGEFGGGVDGCEVCFNTLLSALTL